MTGHIRRRGERSWELKYDVGADGAGRRKTRYASVKGTKRDAQIELAKLIAAAANGDQVDPSRMTVAEFFDRWERDWVASNVSPKTGERYSELLRLHAKPRIGAMRLQKLRPLHLTELYGTLAANLAPRTIGHVHRVLHQALSLAVDWDVVASNVAARVSPPRVEQEEVEILTAPEIKAILEKARGRTIHQIATLALATGMRRGELLAWRAPLSRPPPAFVSRNPRRATAAARSVYRPRRYPISVSTGKRTKSFGWPSAPASPHPRPWYLATPMANRAARMASPRPGGSLPRPQR
jgi:Phage integrase, N-terminal SAM-like domain